MLQLKTVILQLGVFNTNSDVSFLVEILFYYIKIINDEQFKKSKNKM